MTYVCVAFAMYDFLHKANSCTLPGMPSSQLVPALKAIVVLVWNYTQTRYIVVLADTRTGITISYMTE